ncbi:hypothetical protein SAY87_002158 [Trapa incisa]|uniref:Uncharacterized protein n=1 Tax=Trapa incisa TaxID=236973 RepID=A0AAN7PUI4_9MYRT|nr:hypothetical protein SAY87_002158 [Trapa incisa]
MGVSFKVSRVGTRFRSRPALRQQPTAETAAVSNSSGGIAGNTEAGVVSAVLHLFADGYSIGKLSENENVNDLRKSIRPYNRASQSLFSAIECGQIPGDILDDYTCKYIDGSIICEVRDYRKAAPQQGPNTPTIVSSPVVTKVKLKISLENVVRDIPLISDSSWTYGDLMEVESRILKVLQPKLCLDPTPKLDKLCNEPIPPKLKVALSSACKKRRHLPEITVTSSNRMHCKKLCIDRNQESSDLGMVPSSAMQQNVPESIPAQNVGLTSTMNASPRGLITDSSFSGLPLIAHQRRYQMMVGNSRGVMDWGAPAPPSAQDISYSDSNQTSPSLHGKRENQEGAMSPLASSNTHKRTRPASGIHDANQQQQLGQKIDTLHGSDMNWKNSLLQQQVLARGLQHPNASLQKYPSQQYHDGMLKNEPGVGTMPSGFQGIRHGSMEEHIDAQKLVGAESFQVNKNEMSSMEIDNKDCLDPQQQNQLLQQRVHQNPLMRSGFCQAQWSNMNQHLENNLKREEQLQKRKTVQSPRVSAGALAQSPMSSKSGEFSSGSLGPAFGAVASNQMTGISNKDRSVVTSVPSVGGAGSITSGGNDSTQRQNIAQAGCGKRRSNSLSKTSAITGVGSPISGSNNIPSISMPSMTDQSVLERFSKIEMVTMRYQLNRIKNKVDNCALGKPGIFPTEGLMSGLSKISSNEDFKDGSCTLSKSLLGGSMNSCKTILLTCVLGDHRMEGGDVSFLPKLQSRMILSEKPSNGTVVIAYGDMEEGNVLDVEDHLPTLPNAHLADLLVEQFKSLMEKDGYRVTEHTQLKMIHENHQPTNSQSTNPGIPSSNSTGQTAQYTEGVSAQSPNELSSAGNGGNASVNQSQNLLANSRMLPPPNPQALQISQGLMPGVSMAARPQPMDIQQKLQQKLPQNQNQVITQQPQFSRPPMMLNSNPLSQLNSIGQNSNIQMGDPMNKSSALQLHHLLQQQQQQQPSPQQNQQQQQQTSLMQRKMMGMGNMGMGMGMGNIGANLAGFPGLGNAMGMGGLRGIGGTGISAPMGPMPSLGNVGQNQMNLAQPSSISNVIGQGFHPGNLTTAQVAALNIRMIQQNRANILGGPQSGTGGVPGARQMPLGSGGLQVLGPGMNRPNMGAMQRPVSGTMAPPKMMSGMNIYVNQQQQQLQQQQVPQKLNQHETNSPLQSVMLPVPQVGSPSNQMGMPQLTQQQLQQQVPQLQQQQLPSQLPQQQQLQPQQPQQQQSSPQQMSQRTPMSPQQMCSSAIQPLSAGNPDVCPASPQVSSQSQTLGSVGSITNPPMDVQNKSNSMGNPP